MSYSKFTDFSSLYKLTKIKNLDLSSSNITSIEFLSQCKSLETLDISYCNLIDDLTALTNCTSLKDLTFKGLLPSQAEILNSLRGLNLESITFGTESSKAFGIDNTTKISISHLSGIKKLTVYYGMLDFADIDHLDLEELDIKQSNIVNCELMSSFKNLKRLSYQNTKYGSYIPGLNPFIIPKDANFDKLEHLQITSQVANTEFLANMKNLKTLDIALLYDSGMPDLSNNKQLESLSINGSASKDLKFVENLSNLKSIDLFIDGLSDISSIGGLSNLEDFHIYVGYRENETPAYFYGKLSDISVLTKLSNLKRAGISGILVEDTDSLNKVKNSNYFYYNNYYEDESNSQS